VHDLEDHPELFVVSDEHVDHAHSVLLAEYDPAPDRRHLTAAAL
jgi:hypothetical protein